MTAVNDAPVNTVPTAQSTDEDTALTFGAAGSNALSVSDVDAAPDAASVRVRVDHGTLTVLNGGGVTFDVAKPNGTADVRFTGTLTAVNAALQGLRYDSAANYNGGDTLAMTSDDLGHNGTGGALTDTDTVAITVDPVNDKPTAEDVTDSMLEDGTPLQIDLKPHVSDIETADPANLTYTVSNPLASEGTRSVTNGVVTFTPAPDFYGPVTLTYSVTDRGDPDDCSAPDPCDGPETSSVQTITITVKPVNDAPSFTKGGNQTVLEDAGPQTVSPWATGISAGPANESSQTVSFLIDSNSNPSLFSAVRRSARPAC